MTLRTLSLFGLSLAALSLNAHATWVIKKTQSDGLIQEQTIEKSERELPAGNRSQQILRSLPLYMNEDAPPSQELYEEILTEELPESLTADRNPVPPMALKQTLHNSEVRTLVSQGPVKNRINLTIVGDGYTLSEKEKFFADAERISKELFVGATFASYLPLFNVYAVFVPSNESGISDGAKKDTAFGLFRDPPQSKRGIMPGNTRAIDQATSLAPATDYPIVLANDDFYGGLGGKYAITTRSLESGIVVLRHELGHNFGQVGEEYDNGYVYTGANFSSSKNVSWSNWLTDGAKVYGTEFLSGNYLWKNLSSGPVISQFNFPKPTAEGGFSFEVLISSVGWQTPDEVSIYLDGQKVKYEGIFTKDRSFFTLALTQTLAPGSHTLEVAENIHDGDNVLAYAEVYAHPPGYDFTPGKIAAFATFDASGRMQGYRPTHFDCIMRNMQSKDFCPIDKENFWLKFLNQVKLIDDLKVSGNPGSRKIQLTTLPLQGLVVKWYSVTNTGVEQELTDLRDLKIWSEKQKVSGMIRAKVFFKTNEVRNYTKEFSSQIDITL